jgi:hypothetical protein
MQKLRSLFDTMQRYAGWLDREKASVAVRADVEALGLAIDANTDVLPLLAALDSSLARLPSGEVRKMMRVASAKIRHELAEAP